MIAVLAGASGLVGSVLLKKLLADSGFSKIICLVRRPLEEKHPKIEEVVTADFTSLKELETKLAGDVYFCCLGTTIKIAKTKEAFRKVDYDSVVEFGRVAHLHQAKNMIVISAMGASESSQFFYSQVKGEADKALQNLGLKRLVLFHPSLLVGDRSKTRPFEELAIFVTKTITPLLPQSLEKKIKTEVDHLATRMVEESKKTNSGQFIIESKDI